MLLIGSTNLTRTKSTGDFYCPNCSAIRDYRLRTRRPFLTLYFIPVVPIGPTEQYVQCSTCRTNSPIQALADVPPGGQLDISEDLLEAAVMIVVADGLISEPEISALQDLGVRLGIVDCDRELLGSLCSSVRLNDIPAANFISTVARSWTEEQKREALKAFFLVATADELGDRQVQLLAWLKQRFGMPDNEYQATIDDVVNRGWDAIQWQLVDGTGQAW